MSLKHNCTVTMNGGAEWKCNYITNYPVAEFMPYGTMMTRILTIDNRRFDLKFEDIYHIEYVTSIDEMVDARMENMEIDGFCVPNDNGEYADPADACDEEDAPPYPMNCSDGKHIEGYN